MDSNFEKTSFETNPVESPEDALHAFVVAYDALQATLAAYAEHLEFANTLRGAIYRPVLPEGGFSPPISLYEIGVVYGHGGKGKYGINEAKLHAALEERAADVSALFVQENGILPHLCKILSEFLTDLFADPNADDSENLENPDDIKSPDTNESTVYVPPEEIYAVAMRFLNESRRLAAIWM